MKLLCPSLSVKDRRDKTNKHVAVLPWLAIGTSNCLTSDPLKRDQGCNPPGTSYPQRRWVPHLWRDPWQQTHRFGWLQVGRKSTNTNGSLPKKKTLWRVLQGGRMTFSILYRSSLLTFGKKTFFLSEYQA